jgi:hypothetical protein
MTKNIIEENEEYLEMDKNRRKRHIESIFEVMGEYSYNDKRRMF